MRIDTYKFDELSDEAKKTAVRGFSNFNVFKWCMSTYEDAATIGLNITEFDLSRSSWTKDAETVAALILENHGESCETHFDATVFLATCARDKATHDDYAATHEYWELCREFKKTIREDYRIMLEKEHDRLSSEEAIIETIKMNEWEFTADGENYL